MAAKAFLIVFFFQLWSQLVLAGVPGKRRGRKKNSRLNELKLKAQAGVVTEKNPRGNPPARRGVAGPPRCRPRGNNSNNPRPLTLQPRATSFRLSKVKPVNPWQRRRRATFCIIILQFLLSATHRGQCRGGKKTKRKGQKFTRSQLRFPFQGQT